MQHEVISVRVCLLLPGYAHLCIETIVSRVIGGPTWTRWRYGLQKYTIFSVLMGLWEQRDIKESKHLPSVVCEDWVPCSWSRNLGHFGEREKKIQVMITMRSGNVWAFLDKVGSCRVLVESFGRTSHVVTL